MIKNSFLKFLITIISAIPALIIVIFINAVISVFGEITAFIIITGIMSIPVIIIKNKVEKYQASLPKIEDIKFQCSSIRELNQEDLNNLPDSIKKKLGI